MPKQPLSEQELADVKAAKEKAEVEAKYEECRRQFLQLDPQFGPMLPTKLVMDGKVARPVSCARALYSCRPSATACTTSATNFVSRNDARAPTCATRFTPKWRRTLLNAEAIFLWAMT